MMTCRMTSHSYWWRGTVQLSWTAVQYSCILPWTAWVRAHEDGGRTASDGKWSLKIVPPESPQPPAGFLSLRAMLPKTSNMQVWQSGHWYDIQATCTYTKTYTKTYVFVWLIGGDCWSTRRLLAVKPPRKRTFFRGLVSQSIIPPIFFWVSEDSLRT